MKTVLEVAGYVAGLVVLLAGVVVWQMIRDGNYRGRR